MEIAGDEMQSANLDHHGLVAAMCKELKIREKIDEKLGPGDKRRVVSAGMAVVAMILNGLGFTNRRLYLTHQFFQSKPIERLLGERLSAAAITDHTLGQALDEIADYGSSRLFGEVAFEIAVSHDLLGQLNHLDTTSLSVHGQYDRNEPVETIEITHGHSKDHRPDLKQVVLSLVVNGPSAFPLWMEALDGNSSDKTSFHETIARVRAFQRQIALESDFQWLADAALYSKDKLLKQNDYHWSSRVPETIKQAKELVQRPDEAIDWVKQPDGYRLAGFESDYGGLNHRWVLVYSEHAYQREKATWEKKLTQQQNALDKALWHLQNQSFACEADARSAGAPLQKKYRWFTLDFEVEPIEKHSQRGRPRPGTSKVITGYRLVAQAQRNEPLIEQQLRSKGRFILATNVLDKQAYPDERLLAEYKEQQAVERGFRFLKDPWFMVDSIFLKSPQRIEALMMVMTLCLLVYNVAQYRLRQTLKAQNDTLPNQLDQPIQNPTMRWIFQLMEGISIVRIVVDPIHSRVQEFITNLSTLRRKIIRLFGQAACEIYGLITESSNEVLGM